MLRSQTLGDLLRRSAARVPDRLAVASGAVRWRYRELDALCSRLAAGFAAIGVAPGDRVAVLARNSHAFIAIRYALARHGAVLVPVNYMLKSSEAGYILGHAGAKILCTDSEFLVLAHAAAVGTAVERIVWLPAERPGAPAEGLMSIDDLLAAGDGVALPEPAVDGRDLLQLVYTSGTEALPKGVMLTHEAVIAQYVSVLVEGAVREGDRLLHAMPLFHCAQLDAAFGPALYVGAENVVTADASAGNLLALIARERIGWLFLPPTVWIALLRHPDFDTTDLGSLATGLYGASIMPVEILRELQRRLPHLRLWNAYGQTEIAPVATYLRPEDQLRKAGSAGKPVLNVETRLVDEDGADVPAGTVGEVVHRSPQLLTGYYNDPARTAEAFRGGWFHSGDLGVMDEDGYLTIVDRKKDMIKTGGENVASREVEEAIYALPEIEEVAVIGLAHPIWIEAVTAVVVPRSGHAVSGPAVIAHCAARLAKFKVPKQVIVIDALPKNPSGKVLKRDLRRRFEA